MRFDWRAGAVAAAAAFLLSFFAGIFGGVAFGVLVVRAIVGSLVFGAGAVVVSYVIDRYLPDLKQSLSGTGSGATGADERAGGRVDIVVDDDGPEGFEASEFEMEEVGDSVDASTDEGDPDDEDAGLEVEELESEDGSAAGFTPGLAAERVHAPGAEASETGDESVEELDEAEAESAGESVAERRDAPEDLEEAAPEAVSPGGLPDIEGFSGSFSDAPTEGEDANDSESSAEDPGMMARAIRTVLKREE